MHAAARRRGSSPLYPAGGLVKPAQHMTLPRHAGAPPQSPGLFGSLSAPTATIFHKQTVVALATLRAAEGRRDWGTECPSLPARPSLAVLALPSRPRGRGVEPLRRAAACIKKRKGSYTY